MFRVLDRDLSGTVDRQELEQWLADPPKPGPEQGQHPHYYAGKEKERLRMLKAQERADHDPAKAAKATQAKHKLLSGLIEKRGKAREGEARQKLRCST